MAHFAELNSSNVVLQIVVISNDEVDANGGDLSDDAETFVGTIVPHTSGGTAWKQTSYNNKFRKQYAGMGYTYDATNNVFIEPKPHASWTLNGSFDWQAPVTYPSVTKIGGEEALIRWDETNKKWLATEADKNYTWNTGTSAWDEV